MFWSKRSIEKARGADSASDGATSIQRIKVGLAGNPNSGKTTIFNELTGAHQKVGNWPGVTVEVKSGTAYYKGFVLEITDLPGTYSLSAQSQEEIIARDYILDHLPDVMVQIVEGPNIERNLYLTTQLIDLEVPVVIALNMFDEVKSRKIDIHIKKLSQLLGMPIVPTIGKRGKGMRRLMEAIIKTAQSKEKKQKSVKVNYGHEVEEHIEELIETINLTGSLRKKYPPRWLAISLIEGDEYAASKIKSSSALSEQLFVEAMEIRKHLSELFKGDTEEYMADRRYGFINGALKETMKLPEKQEITLTQRLDSIFTNRIIGLPILFFLMWVLFQSTFGLGKYPVEWINIGINFLTDFTSRLLPNGLAKDLIVDGIIGGVGSVIIFLPNILILFLGIAFLEDSGYMARAAFVTDRVMHALGLHGKSFIPLLMGFGCSVPAIMATRMLDSRRDRLLTMLIVPLMSCSARLPVYILLAGTFFPNHAGNVIFGIYILGIFAALLIGRLFSSTIFKGQYSPFVMELPSYRWPTTKSILIHMWYRSKIYLRKMGGIILIGSIVLWFLGTFPRQQGLPSDLAQMKTTVEKEYNSEITQSESDMNKQTMLKEYNRKLAEIDNMMASRQLENTFIGRLGRVIAPVVRPLGFDWKIGVAILTGFVAKEVVVSSMGVLYAVGEGGGTQLSKALKSSEITPLIAAAFAVFVLLYTPCIASIAAIFRESGSAKWVLLSISYQTTLAWITAFIIYRGGLLLGLG